MVVNIRGQGRGVMGKRQSPDFRFEGYWHLYLGLTRDQAVLLPFCFFPFLGKNERLIAGYFGTSLGLFTNIRIFFEIFRSFRDILKILENFKIFRKLGDI